MRTGKAAALLMMSLMLIAIPGAHAEQSVDAGDEVINYTNERIEVMLDEDAGELKLILGPSRMHLEWGVQDDPGEISLLTAQTRHLGIADTYDRDGQFQKRVGIPIHTIFYQKLDGILEYEDSNDDGIFNLRGQGLAGTLEEMKDKDLDHEPIAKWVSFKDIAWEMQGFNQDCDANNCSIEFSLVAEDLNYSSKDGETNGTLELIRYDFRISTKETSIDVENVPHYRVGFHRGSDDRVVVDDSDEVGGKNVSAEVLNSVWKYDQVVNGWDAEGNDSRLLTVVEYGMGSYLTENVAGWAKEQYGKLPGPKPFAGHAPAKKDLGARGPQMDTHDRFGRPLKCNLDYVEKDGSQNNDSVREQIKEYKNTHCSSDGEELKEDKIGNASMIRAGGLHFDDEGARWGSIRWVSNATIDGVEEEVLFQIHGIRPVVRADLRNNSLPDGVYKGIRMIGGYNHPIGDNITHDPEYDVDVMTNMETLSFGEPLQELSQRGPLQMLMRLAPILAGVIIVGVAGTVLVAKRKARKAAMVPKSAEFPAMGQLSHRGNDWAQYAGEEDKG